MAGRRWVSLFAAFAVAFAVVATAGMATAAPGRRRLGVRLVDGPSRTQGRLEVLVPTVPDLSGGWYPFCDASFTQEHAKLACRLLGLKYGRKFYASGVNYDANTTGDGATSGLQQLACSPRRGRSLRGVDLDLEHEPQDQQLRQQHGRQLQALPIDDVPVTFKVARKLKLQCSALASFECLSPGPWAGVECSSRPFTGPATTSPATPPVRPPPPAPLLNVSDVIRVVGGALEDGRVERNLCAPGGGVEPFKGCRDYGRVELLLPSPSAPGTKVWAPLCAANYGVWGDALARAVCRQRYIAREQVDGSGRVVQSVGGTSGNFSFAVPSGSVPASGFKPSTFAAWATLPPAGPSSLLNGLDTVNQVPGLQVSATPCQGLYAVECEVLTPLSG